MTDQKETILDIITRILSAVEDGTVTNEMVGRCLRYLQEKDESILSTVNGNIDTVSGEIFEKFNDYWTKSQMQAKLEVNYYDKTEIDDLLTGKISADDETTIAEIDSLFTI